MPNFRKKPVVISAEQWLRDKPVVGVVQPRPNSTTQFYPYIRTLEGDHLVSPGDWVITGIASEKYCCKDSIFRATYDPTDDESAIALGWDDLDDYTRRSQNYLSECDEEKIDG